MYSLLLYRVNILNTLVIEMNLCEIQNNFPFYKDIDESQSICKLKINRLGGYYKNYYDFRNCNDIFFLSYEETLENIKKYNPIHIYFD